MSKASSAKPAAAGSASAPASTKKRIYADALKAKTRQQTQAVQAALRGAHAGRLLFRKA